MSGLTFSFELDWGSYIISIAKTASKKIGALFLLRSFFLLRFLCISIIPYGHVWNTAAMSRLVLLAATWDCQTSYKYRGLLVLYFLPLLKHWLIVEMQPASIFYIFSKGITLVDVHLNWFNWFHFLILEGGLLVIVIDCTTFLSLFLDVTRMCMSTVSFLAQLDSRILCLQNASP